MAIPFNQMPVGEGLDPKGQPGAAFFVDRRILDVLEQDGPEWKFEAANFLPEAAREPDAIFEGLKRTDREDCFCYSVRPMSDPDDEDSSILPRFGQAFVVFVRASTWGYVAFDWEWREEDPALPGYPLNWENDFTRRTWSRI